MQTRPQMKITGDYIRPTYIHLLTGRTISWESWEQRYITLSSTEVEYVYVTLSNEAREVVYTS